MTTGSSFQVDQLAHEQHVVVRGDARLLHYAQHLRGGLHGDEYGSVHGYRGRLPFHSQHEAMLNGQHGEQPGR